MMEARFERAAVLGYSHGGTVAQQLAHTRPKSVSQLVLACTYAYNMGTPRERIEASLFLALVALLGPRTIADLVVRPSKPKHTGAIGPTKEQADWLRDLMGTNHSGPMRGAVRGMITFDSRSWLSGITAPTLVVGGADDIGVPRYHFDMLVNGIPGASGRQFERAGHTLIWTHTRQLADVTRAFCHPNREVVG